MACHHFAVATANSVVAVVGLAGAGVVARDVLAVPAGALSLGTVAPFFP